MTKTKDKGNAITTQIIFNRAAWKRRWDKVDNEKDQVNRGMGRTK